MTTTKYASVTTRTAITAVASSTGHGGSPHGINADDDTELMVDYN